jgi:chitodextrinase
MTGTTYTNTDLRKDTKYWYAVVAHDRAGNYSAASSVVSASAK